MTSRAAIIDPFASGAWLAPDFSARGIECIAVRSTASIPEVFATSFIPGDFVEVIQHEGDVVRTANSLRDHDVRFALAGCELGVELSDALSDRLCFPSNGAAGSPARRDKFLMAEKVRNAGLRTPDQLRSGDRDEVVEWARRRDRWPVVVKPLRSSSSDHVSRCETASEVGEAFDDILRSPTVLDQTNDAVLVQEYLEGTEYIVDTVSRDGRHLLAAVWSYGKPASATSFVCYDSMTLLPGDGEKQRALVEFACGVLDALGIRHGPAHCELMWVDEEPALVEVGARLSAGNNCTVNRECSGVCQLDLTVEAYADPERFLARDARPYVLTRAATNVFLMPETTGILRGAPRLAEVEALESVVEMHVGLEPGEPVPRVAGVVTLLHDDPSVIERDLRHIRELERSGLYDIEPNA